MNDVRSPTNNIINITIVWFVYMCNDVIIVAPESVSIIDNMRRCVLRYDDGFITCCRDRPRCALAMMMSLLRVAEICAVVFLDMMRREQIGRVYGGCTHSLMTDSWIIMDGLGLWLYSTNIIHMLKLIQTIFSFLSSCTVGHSNNSIALYDESRCS